MQARKMQNVIQPGGEKVDIIDITTDSDVIVTLIFFIHKFSKQFFFNRMKR